MRQFLFTLGLIVFGALCGWGQRVIVADTGDGCPVAGATVIGSSGLIMGLTDDEGAIIVNKKELPLTIKCIGYSPMITSQVNDTIGLEPMPFHLNEVMVSTDERPVMRVLCFAREYNTGITGNDTMQYYCEYMAEAFLVDGKVKGYRGSDANPTAKGHRRYARIIREGRDSIFRPKRGDDITDLSWFDFMAFLPDKKVDVPESMKNGAAVDTVAGKYGPRVICRSRNGRFSKSVDVLSDKKDRKWSPFFFKLIGMTSDITDGRWTLSFAENGSGSYGIRDFLSGTYNIHVTCRGKWLKKLFKTGFPIEMDTYLEIYPIDIENITLDEYKEMRDDFSPVAFQYPAGLEPLSPAIGDLVRSVDQKDR